MRSVLGGSVLGGDDLDGGIDELPAGQWVRSCRCWVQLVGASGGSVLLFLSLSLSLSLSLHI